MPLIRFAKYCNLLLLAGIAYVCLSGVCYAGSVFDCTGPSHTVGGSAAGQASVEHRHTDRQCVSLCLGCGDLTPQLTRSRVRCANRRTTDPCPAITLPAAVVPVCAAPTPLSGVIDQSPPLTSCHAPEPSRPRAPPPAAS